ncbi:lipid droplet assembly factor 1-like isoform 1-T5 [Odontesthes bonariensis]|uniref:lipid droplet assembly factor 1-like n=1 Tax=Odontesthes bonariensis TaxID=219752 RepID=UPI003F580EA2
MQRSSRLTQQLWKRWTTLLNRLQNDPMVAQVVSARIRQYLSSHPFSALTLLLFGAMAALPVGLFLIFTSVTIAMSATGFLFFAVFLLFVGGLTLLSVLSGIAIFSVLVSVIVNALFITIPSLLKHKDPLPMNGVNRENLKESEASGPKEM